MSTEDRRPSPIRTDDLAAERNSGQTESLLAEFEAEKPARKLSGIQKHIAEPAIRLKRAEESSPRRV